MSNRSGGAQRSQVKHPSRSALTFLIASVLLPVPAVRAETSASTTSTLESVAAVEKPVLKGAKLSFSAGLAARDILDEQVHSTAALSNMRVAGSHEFSENFSGHMKAGAFFGESSATALYGNEGDSYSVVGIDYAYVSFQPIPAVDLEAGVLGQNFSTLPATFRTDGFLGAQESYTLGDSEATYLAFNATQILPSSSTAEKRASSDRQTPLLMMAGVDNGLKFSENTKLTTKAQYFRFSNLTSEAAHNSRLYNTTYGFGSDGARFAYGFEGMQLATSLENQWTGPLKTTLHAGYMVNRMASPGTGEGYAAALVADYKLPKIEISPLIGVYYNERNVLPAVYTDVYNSLGKINRLATSFYLSVKIPDQGLSFFGRYVQTNLIEEEFSLSDRRIITVGMEASYDIL